MAGSTEKPLGYRVKMLPDANAVNSEIKIEKKYELVVIQYDISNTIKLRQNKTQTKAIAERVNKKRLLNTSKCN